MKRGQLVEFVGPFCYWRAIFHNMEGDQMRVHSLFQKRGTHLIQPIGQNRMTKIRFGWRITVG